MCLFQIPRAETLEPLAVSAALVSPSLELGWYALYTRSNFEKRVAEELTFQDVDNFLPLITEVHRWKDRSKKVDLPVFPGYVFVRMADREENRVRALRTLGAVRILGSAGRIERIPDMEIESVRRLLGANVRCFAHPFLREGALVRVTRGVLKDLEGLLIRVKNQTRLVLSINLLSQSVAAEIDIHDVEVVRPAPVRAAMTRM